MLCIDLNDVINYILSMLEVKEESKALNSLDLIVPLCMMVFVCKFQLTYNKPKCSTK